MKCHDMRDRIKSRQIPSQMQIVKNSNQHQPDWEAGNEQAGHPAVLWTTAAQLSVYLIPP